MRASSASDGNEAKAGEAGELILRADDQLAFATGYFAMPDKTAEAFRDGWFHTGDRVVREADGYFRFVDRLEGCHPPPRRKYLFFRSRAGAAQPPRRRHCGGFPVPSELAEEEVMAAIVRRPGSALTESTL